MTKQQIINAALRTAQQMQKAKKWIPRKTGNLAFNALRFKIEGNTLVIYIDTDIAPYAPYTTEPWLSPKWNGAKNPNEGWWDRFCEEFVKRFNKRLGGKIK